MTPGRRVSDASRSVTLPGDCADATTATRKVHRRGIILRSAFRIPQRWYAGRMALRRLFAEQPVKLSRLPSFRAEHFPYSGPYPWLDQPDALEQIEVKLRS